MLDWEDNFRKTAEDPRSEAKVRLLPETLQITTKTDVYYWPYIEIIRKQKGVPGDPVLLRRGPQPFPELVVHDPSILSHLNNAAPDLTRHLFRPKTPAQRIVFGLAFAVGIAAILYFLVPRFASWMAPIVPFQMEARIGAFLVDGMASKEKRIEDPFVTDATDAILSRLLSSLPLPRPHEVKVIIVKGKTVNAMALPGNSIVIYTGLIQKTKTPEELAGVMAHELEHIASHHVMRTWLQQMSSRLILHALMGRLSGPLSGLYGNAGSMLILHYSRDFEREADGKGILLLQSAQIDPIGMIHFIEMLQIAGDVPEILTYVSTHPSTEERIQHLKELANRSSQSYSRLLPNFDWDKFKSRCLSTT